MSEIPAPRRDIFSVGALNRRVRGLLEGELGLIWVSGELSNLSCPSSGHWYFTLKDADAQVRCAMFRNKAQYAGFRPKDGQQVLLRARVSLYEPRGDYQLIAEYMEPAGVGALQRAFEALKTRLAAEGLFDSALKRPLPAYPRAVGLITSASGAVLHDVLTVLKRRMPSLPVILYPSAVQGAEAVPQLLKALHTANQRREVDVLIIGRGGGSLEDLWCFNDERVARAIRASAIPIVSAVGHEVDVSIADFAADWRAATPSAAAEAVSPDRAEQANHLGHLRQRLIQRFRERLGYQRRHLDHLSRRLSHPARRLERAAQRLDELSLRLAGSQERRRDTLRHRLERLQLRLMSHTPTAQVQQRRSKLERKSEQLHERMKRRLELAQLRLAGLARELQTLSPLTTLLRGYSITQDGAQKRALRSVGDTAPGELITTRLTDGQITSRVLEITGEPRS